MTKEMGRRVRAKSERIDRFPNTSSRPPKAKAEVKSPSRVKAQSVRGAALNPDQQLRTRIEDVQRFVPNGTTPTSTVLALASALRLALQDGNGEGVREETILDAAYLIGGALRARSRFFEFLPDLPARPACGTVTGVDRSSRRRISTAIRRATALVVRLAELADSTDPWKYAFDGTARSSVRNVALLHGADRGSLQRTPRLWKKVARPMAELLEVVRWQCEHRPFRRLSGSLNAAMNYVEKVFATEIEATAEFRALRVSSYPSEPLATSKAETTRFFESWRRWVELRRTWWLEIADAGRVRTQSDGVHLHPNSGAEKLRRIASALSCSVRTVERHKSELRLLGNRNPNLANYRALRREKDAKRRSGLQRRRPVNKSPDKPRK